jgi:hypothetical protein
MLGHMNIIGFKGLADLRVENFEGMYKETERVDIIETLKVIY